MSSDLVLVTGASGYIATHIVQQLQQQGHRVRGTVRSLKNEEKVKPLKELCPDAKYPLELVEADLLDGDCWKNVVSGCTFVIHVASPVPAHTVQDEDEIIRPAVDGTLNILHACKESNSVKRVVITSSTSAIKFTLDKHNPLTERDWTDLSRNDLSAYEKSKTMAERAAWKYVEELQDDGEKLELAVINPVFVTGPMLCGTIATSISFTKPILEDASPSLPTFPVGVIDVRDVATAHIKAMTLPKAAGNRHILMVEHTCFREIAEIVDNEFRPQGYNVNTSNIPWVSIESKLDNSRMISVLGIKPKSLKDSIIDMCYSMIENGIIKRTDGYRNPNM